MNIQNYRSDPRFSACKHAFLVTGTQDHDLFNQKLLRNNKTGNWVVRKNRVNPDDLIFLLLPHPTNSSGYPRALYAGIIAKVTRNKSDDREVFTVKEFHLLDPVENEIKIFLGNKVPPQGNKVNDVWGTTNIRKGRVGSFPIADEDDESSFPEGAEKYRLHRGLERDPKIVRKAKQTRQKTNGKLECDVCKFDFVAFYGERGTGFIEGHHKTPVSKLDKKTKTNIKDIALVCSNCHRMLHRGQHLASIEEMKKLLKLNEKK
jgi:hypothetical protein